MSAYAALKALHIGALVIWCAGLLVIPTLYRHRSRVPEGEAVHELHWFTRAVFVNIMSPAAFVAVASGTGLIFVGNVFEVWMFLKLAVVGLLVLLHMWAGLVILKVFNTGQAYQRWRQVVTTAATAGVISIILILVLLKPDVVIDLPYWLKEPGSLQSFSETILPIP